LQRSFSSANGLLGIELTAAEGWVQLTGSQARLYAFNEQVPGPLLDVQPGDEVRIRFINRLREPTNLHFHGLHIPSTGNADNVFLEIPPGELLDYSLSLPSNHPAGLFWVHPHHHGLVAQQVSRGLAMPLVVRGELDSIPEIAAAREYFLVLQDFELDSSGRLIEPGMSASMLGREGSLITVSGQRHPLYEIEQDGLLRLRLLNASASRFYRLRLEEHPMHLIATDGGALAAPQGMDELVMAPGQRRDVLIQGARERGTYRLTNLPYDRGTAGMMGGGTNTTPVDVATLVYAGRNERRPQIPRTLVSVAGLPAATVQRAFELSDAMGMIPGRGMGMRFRINGREFSEARVDTRVRLGSTEEWEYNNVTTMDHPMHVHTNSFQAVRTDGQSERAWQDVLIVKAQSKARIRIRFDDYAGSTVQHCHILDHEDLGMMGTILIEP
jgi:FtsP/CotA-like multicopper oxidase with cupredoxin domain